MFFLLCSATIFFSLDCSNKTQSGVNIHYEILPKFNSSGMFTCSQQRQFLFDLNGTQANTNNTVCLYSAKWEREKEFQCWFGRF